MYMYTNIIIKHHFRYEGLHHNLTHLERGDDVYLGEVRGDVVVEPAVEDHVAQRRAHRHQVEAEEGEEVQPGQGYY